VTFRKGTTHNLEFCEPMPEKYAFSIYVRVSMQRKAPMTVSIGSLCNFKNAGNAFILLAVDNRATYENAKVVPNDACGKFHDLLPDPFCISISGAVSTCNAVVAEFHKRIQDRKKQRSDGLIYTDDLRIAIREARDYEYGLFLNEEMQGYLRMSLAKWRKNRDSEIRRKGFAVARAARLYFPVFLIMGGFTKGSAVLMKSSGACVTEMGEGPFVTGIGQVAAINHLNHRKQNHYYSAARTLLHLDEAMKKARVAKPQYIGEPADYIAIRQSGQIMRFPAKSPVLKKWRIDFADRDSLQMDLENSFQQEFEKALVPHCSPNV